MEQRISVVTLGVEDVEVARAFYESLGWDSPSAPGADAVFFQAGATVFALWGRAALAMDSGVADGGGWGGITLAHNVDSDAEVDELVMEAAAHGAVVSRGPGTTFWGGYSGVFVDPDGHAWEVAHNPQWPVTDDGAVRLPR